MLLFYYKDVMAEGHSIIYYTCSRSTYQENVIKFIKSSIQRLQFNQIEAILLISFVMHSSIRGFLYLIYFKLF